MDTSTPAVRRQISRDPVAMFLESLDPTTGRLPEPRAPKRGRFGGGSLAVFSRDPKRRACARLDHMQLWHGTRLYVKLLINRGRGKRCRSWGSDAEMAECMTFTAGCHYSEAHATRCRKQAEDFGIIASNYVPPHSPRGCIGADKCSCGHFPNAKAPDVDGGGLRTNIGGRVKEVNLAFLLGEGDRWPGPKRFFIHRGGCSEAVDAREEPEAAPDEPAPTSTRPALVALDGGRAGVDDVDQGDELEAPLEASYDPADPGGGGIIHAPGGGDHPYTPL